MRGRMKVHYRVLQPSAEALRRRPTRWMVVPRPFAVATALNRHGIEHIYANDDLSKLHRCQIARLCPPDHLLAHVFRRRAAACAEVGKWASCDRIGVWRAGAYHILTVCNAACFGSSQKRRQSDRCDQHAYRGAASKLPMVPEARLSGHSRSAMASVRPVLSTIIIV